MNARTLCRGCAALALGFVAGFGAARWPGVERAGPPPATGQLERAQEITSLRGENEQLRVRVAEWQRQAVEARSLAHRVSAEAVPMKGPSTLGLARWEVQQDALKNLRRIDAARVQFRLENGRPAASIHELIGRQSHLRSVRTVSGEEYTGLSMIPGEPMTVTTPDGITVTFDPSGATTTLPDIPPEVLRVREMAERMDPVIDQAVAAFRATNGGRHPKDERALLPYFATTRDAADFVELKEAARSARQ